MQEKQKQKDSSLIANREQIVNHPNAASYPKYVAKAWHIEADLKRFLSRLPESVLLYKKAVAVADKGQLPEVSGDASLYASFTYHIMGQYDLSIKEGIVAYKNFEKVGVKKKQARALWLLGSNYYKLKNFDEADKNLQGALEQFSLSGDSIGMADCYVNLGLVFKDAKAYMKALNNFKQSEAIYRKLENPAGLSAALTNKGGVLLVLKEYNAASDALNEALTLKVKIGSKFGEMVIKQHMAEIAFESNKKEGIAKMMAIGKEIKENSLYDLLSDYYSKLADFYERDGNYKECVKYTDLYLHLRDSMFTQEKNNSIAQMNALFENEKQEKEIRILNAENKINEQELEKERNTKIIFSVILILLFAFIFVVYKAYTNKKKDNLLLITQKRQIEAHKTEILDSINYASRIQRALLASTTLLEQNLPDHFVLYKPKDIVSGDFYWATPSPEGFIYITADCTGHGVPGAFMSLLNISKLSQTINENKIYRPDLILNNVRSEIIKALNPEGSAEESKDGMDAVLCKIDIKKMKLEYAAANNSFYIIRNNEVLVCKPDKMPVGKGHDDSVLFSYNEVSLKKGDLVYTFTDGFADQFGGPKGKKFKYKQLEEKLLSIHQEPMHQQRELLQQSFDSWKGALEQVDDVCIIGVRV